MTDFEDLLRQVARRREWTIDANKNRISVGRVPYRKKNGETGTCQVTVELDNDGVTMKAPVNGEGAIHAATLIGVTEGRAYRANGQLVGNVLWTDKVGECVLSIKRDDGEYVNGWHALIVYTASIAGEVEREAEKETRSVFKFDVEGEDSRDMQTWRGRARGQKIGIVGLGGVGLWILDLMSKTDVSEIHVWDGDEIEGRNLIRAPGWAGQGAIEKKKSQYFGEQYGQMREGISIQERYWQPDDLENRFEDLDFVFIAIDIVETRTALCDELEQKEIPFIDAGMGIELSDGQVRGSCQVFYSGDEPHRWRTGIPTVEGAGEEYYHKLQLAELGALNAALAVGMWRRHVGQYENVKSEWLIRYVIEDNDFLKRKEEF